MTEKPEDVILEYTVFVESGGKLVSQMCTETGFFVTRKRRVAECWAAAHPPHDTREKSLVVAERQITEWKKCHVFEDNFVIGNLIRSVNSASFRSGQWGEIAEKVTILRPDNSFRKCVKVVFPDGASDIWPMHDKAAEYEFDRF